MNNFKRIGRRILIGLPLAAALGASFFPLSKMAQQGLVGFTLIWLYVYFLDFWRTNKFAKL